MGGGSPQYECDVCKKVCEEVVFLKDRGWVCSESNSTCCIALAWADYTKRNFKGVEITHKDCKTFLLEECFDFALDCYDNCKTENPPPRPKVH